MGEEGDRRDSQEVAVARLAARQHGVVSIAQLRAAGIGANAVTRWVRRGRLHRVHRGVYAVGHAGLSIEGWWMAAVLACGEGAVLSHAAAAALWGLLGPVRGAIDVSVPTSAGRAHRGGIRVHRCATLAREGASQGPGRARVPPAATVRRGIPVTSVPRTLEDLRGAVPARLHRRAIRQAELAGFALGAASGGDRTRSDLERDFLAFCWTHDIPRPEVNARIGRWKVDFLWREARLVVETDSYRYHRGSVAFEDDHARDLGLRRLGFTVRRYTGAQIRNRPTVVVADLRAALPAPDAPHGPPDS
jgi:Transcriptional regulator, AbiEi antitoxin/Protein of unknown function (DUF559)